MSLSKNVPTCGWDTKVQGGLLGDTELRGATVDKEQLPVLQRLHNRLHGVFNLSKVATHMIIDARYIGDIV